MLNVCICESWRYNTSIPDMEAEPYESTGLGVTGPFFNALRQTFDLLRFLDHRYR